MEKLQQIENALSHTKIVHWTLRIKYISIKYLNVAGEGRGGGQEGEMTQTMYTHVNNKKTFKN
jgi:hypothetical protein